MGETCRRSWRDDTYALLTDLEETVPTFQSSVVAGYDHGLLRIDAFYRYSENGNTLVEWPHRFLTGEAIESVRCEECVPP